MSTQKGAWGWHDATKKWIKLAVTNTGAVKVGT